jgi:hypothetical protein
MRKKTKKLVDKANYFDLKVFVEQEVEAIVEEEAFVEEVEESESWLLEREPGNLDNSCFHLQSLSRCRLDDTTSHSIQEN